MEISQSEKCGRKLLHLKYYFRCNILRPHFFDWSILGCSFIDAGSYCKLENSGFVRLNFIGMNPADIWLKHPSSLFLKWCARFLIGPNVFRWPIKSRTSFFYSGIWGVWVIYLVFQQEIVDYWLLCIEWTSRDTV